MKWRHIPNIITAFRLLMVAPFLYVTIEKLYFLAFLLFVLASISDGLDGFFARRFHWQSKIGAFSDPLADKLLITTSYIALTWNHALPLWFTILMVSRDLTIILGVIAWYHAFRQIEFAPTLISKINTVFQLALIVVVLFQQAFHNLPCFLMDYLLLLTTSTTAFSFGDYVVCWSIKALKKRKSLG